MPFSITPARAKAWLSCMNAALHELDIDDHARTFILQRLTLTAQHMVNTKPHEDG